MIATINGSAWMISCETRDCFERGIVPPSFKHEGNCVEPLGELRYKVFFSPSVARFREAAKEVEGYEDLTRILNEALEQATSGKGKERHAGGKPFDKQPIMEIARMTGLAYQTGQAMKKIQESHTLLEIKGKEAAINELRGAIIYLAAAIKTIEEK